MAKRTKHTSLFINQDTLFMSSLLVTQWSGGGAELVMGVPDMGNGGIRMNSCRDIKHPEAEAQLDRVLRAKTLTKADKFEIIRALHFR